MIESESEMKEVIASEDTLRAYLERKLDYLVDQSGLSPDEIKAMTNPNKGCSLVFWGKPHFKGNRNVPSETAIRLRDKVGQEPTLTLIERLAQAYDRIAENGRKEGYHYPENSSQKFSTRLSASKNIEEAMWLRLISERFKGRDSS